MFDRIKRFVQSQHAKRQIMEEMNKIFVSCGGDVEEVARYLVRAGCRSARLSSGNLILHAPNGSRIFLARDCYIINPTDEEIT